MRAVLTLVLVLPAAARAQPGTVTVGGRVFARGETARFDGEEYVADGRIASARAEARWEWEWLRAIVEVELRRNASLRDAYLRGTWGPWRAQAGQFKEPVSVIEMESAWDLPLATRGLLHEVLTERMQIASRHPGLMGVFRGEGPLRPRAYLGFFQGIGTAGDPRPDSFRSAARASAKIGPARVGAFFEHRDAEPVAGMEIERFFCAGLDAMLDVAGVRAWADVLYGTSWVDAVVQDDDEATFLVARAIVAYRIGGEEGGRFYVEPYLSGGVLDPDLEIRKDLIRELAGGVNVGAWRRVRLQLEVERWDGQRNTPEGFLVRDRLAFVAQIGAAF